MPKQFRILFMQMENLWIVVRIIFLEGTSVSCTSYGVNSPGSQFWEGVGIHVAGELEGESYASRYW